MADAVHTTDMDQSAQGSSLARNFSLVAGLAFAVAAIGVLTQMSAGFLYRLHILPLGTALQGVLPWGAYIALGGAGLCLLAIIASFVVFKGDGLKRAALPIIGLLAGAISAGTPAYMRYLGPTWAPIHDISTDLENPPQYVDVLPLRKETGATNTADYLIEMKRGDLKINVPDAQRKSYPDIQPVILAGVPPAEAFNRALEAVKKQGWTLASAKPEEGHIEAWERSHWFGFYDDVVIRITPADNGSRVDIRSNSRVGGGDVGMNTLRIRKYVKTLSEIKG